MGSSVVQGREGGVAPTELEVREHLEKILASRLFVRSSRLCRFLRYSIEQALAGTGDQVKEYLIGVEVFDRKTDYDPRIDPIVRVEARRLRSKLKAYYSTSGKSDAVTIELPKGAYTPAFRCRSASRPAERAESETSILVLPFTNLTPDAGDDYFSDGLTEQLIHLLTRVPRLRVVAWHSASQLRGREKDLHGIREQLKVGVVLRGSVRRSAGQIRVTAQLIDTGSGAYLWSETYDRGMHDLFAIEEEIARAIVDTFQLALNKRPRSNTALGVPDLKCYNLCLQGRFHANKRTVEGLTKSAACFEEAIAVDGRCALAYAGLADAHILMADYALDDSSDAIPKARAAAGRALELDPDSVEANSSMAFIRSGFDWKWAEAETLYRRAIALNPGYSKSRHWFAIDYLAMLGRFEEAASEINAAQRLDPLSLIIHEGSASLDMLQRDYATALEKARQMIELDAGFYKAHSCMGRILNQMGRYRESIDAFQTARSMAPAIPNILGALGQTFALAGEEAKARQCLRDLAEMEREKYVPSTCYAILHLGLGEIEKCLARLETACDRRELAVASLKVHPVYDPVRSQPRFQSLLRRIGFLP